jgi:uncharacterized membrane protein
MLITFVYPLALWLLLLVPLTIGLAVAGPRRPTPVRFWAGLGLRVVLLVAIVSALAGIQLRLRSDLLTVVFVLDVSDSLPAEQRSQGEAFIRQAAAAMKSGDQVAVVLFGQDALVERLPGDERELPVFGSIPVTLRTNIESALQLALALFPDEGAKRLVLISDGQENVGQALKQAEYAAALDIELSYVPIGGDEGQVEVLVEAVQAPAGIREGQQFELRVFVHSTAETNATLRIFGDTTLLQTQAVRLSAGLNRFVVPVESSQAGFRRFRAQITPDEDTRLQNNEASAFTVVYGPPAVLVVEGQTGEGENLARALEAAEMRVTVITPQRLPGTLPELANYDAVILVNVPASNLPAGSMEALQALVRDLGRGLVMTGGEDGFGAGGYLRTALEETLPVSMDVRNTEQSPNIALVMAVDKSGSMGRCHCDDPDLNQVYTRAEVGQPKVDIAKAAVMEAATALGDQDFVGVVAFDERPKWALEVQQRVDALSMERAIGDIVAEGQTNVLAGVEAAYDSLRETEARVKHVILLTDGWTHGGDLIGLARQMQEEGITLSVVAAGGGSAEYLREMALSGGGQYYPAEDILQVPEFFLKETVRAVGRYIIEEPFYPVMGDPGHPVLRGLRTETLPALFGYNGATPKSTARVSLASPAGDPLLATWQYGLGRAAVWTSDLKGQWAVDWVTWDGFARFASQLVGWTLPAPQVPGLQAEAAYREGEAVLTLTATGEDGLPRNFLDVQGVLVSPGLENVPVSFEQVGPGRYQAQAQLNQTGAYLAQVTVLDGDEAIGQQTLGLIVPYSPEYRLGGIDLALLGELATRTGGTALSDPLETLFRNLPSAERAREIWAPLLLVVAMLFPLDVAIRRVIFSTQDYRKAVTWFVERLPLVRAVTRNPEREARLGQLFDARARARQRTARQAELRQTPQPPRPDKSEMEAEEGDRSTATPPEKQEDTLARLREAKKRSRQQK